MLRHIGRLLVGVYYKKEIASNNARPCGKVTLFVDK
tara:strand:+ start:38301 stop:38408 length:108 start_codon:yes stop_codon:yes gene_type:complete